MIMDFINQLLLKCQRDITVLIKNLLRYNSKLFYFYNINVYIIFLNISIINYHSFLQNLSMSGNYRNFGLNQ